MHFVITSSICVISISGEDIPYFVFTFLDLRCWGKILFYVTSTAVSIAHHDVILYLHSFLTDFPDSCIMEKNSKLWSAIPSIIVCLSNISYDAVGLIFIPGKISRMWWGRQFCYSGIFANICLLNFGIWHQVFPVIFNFCFCLGNISWR